MNITDLANAINERASAYRVGGLQKFRASLRSGGTRTKKLFIQHPDFREAGYAFHDGGRSELQFNVGSETSAGRNRWRHGVAFSFQTSRALPDPRVLVPKVRRFNEWMCSERGSFQGLRMWDWQGDTRSPDRDPGQIGDELIRKGSFVFLGDHVSEEKVDVEDILGDFDRLYPLYVYVESGRPPEALAVTDYFVDLSTTKVTRTTATLGAREIDVNLRENDLQNRVVGALRQELPGCRVCGEFRVARGRVDIALQADRGLVFCELKIAPSARQAIRAALGQLLEYAHWPNGQRASKLWVISESQPSAAERAYLELLRKTYSIPLYYRTFDMALNQLGPEL